jgi:hypothetical protein
MNNDVLKWAALAAALVATASAEYELARAVGFNEWVAAAVPGALDIYTVRALRAHRDVLAAVAAMILVNAASHLVTAGLLPIDVPLVVAVAAIAPLVLWRVHSLALPDAQDTTPSTTVPPVPEPSVTNVPVDRPEPITLERVPEQDAPETPELSPGTGQDTEDASPLEPDLLTSKDVAEKYGVDPSTVRSWVANGTLTVHDKTPRGHNLFHPDTLPQEARP